MADEFDLDFQQLLLETVSNDRMPADICEALQDDHRTRPIANERLREFIYRFERGQFAWMCQFCQMDFLGERPSLRASQTVTTRKKLVNLVRNRTRRTQKTWPYVLGVVYFVIIIIMLVNTYFQYIYNANMAKLDKIKSYLLDGDPGQRLAHLNVTRLQEDFQARASSAHRALVLLGAPNIEWSFVNQSICLTLIISGINLYVVMPLSHVLNGWTLFTPLFVMSPERENRLRSRLILEQLRNFSANSLSYAKSKLERIADDFASLAQEQSNSKSRVNLASISNKVLEVLGRRLAANHQITIRHLKMVALEGRLKPLHRSPACRDKLIITCIVAILFEIVYMQLSILLRHRVLHKFFLDKNLEHEPHSWIEQLNSFCLAILIQFHSAVALFMGLMLISTWFDQREAARRLRMLILHTIRTNQSRLRHLMATSTTRHLSYSRRPSILHAIRASDHRRATVGQLGPAQPAVGFTTSKLCQRVERDLMTIVIQTRLLTRSFELVKRPISLLAFSAICFATTMLSIFRLNSPYFHPELKAFSRTLAILCVVSSFFYLIPLGLLHQHCIVTYRELWSLAAQVSYFETVPQINRCLELESSVAAFSLRRELADSRHRMDQFACRVLALPITNQNLVRIAFWSFLLIMSFSNNINLLGDGLAAFANDPFGLFEFA